MFSLHSPLITLWENAWKMQRSRARENYGKTFRKTSCTLAFSWSRKTIEKHHVFKAFTVSNSVWKMLGKCSVCAWENYGKTSRKTSYTLAYSWSRKTIDKYHVFMTLTISNSVGKHVENEAFAHTGKLQKNFQENRLFIGIFLVQGNMWWTSCFSWVLPRVNGKFAIRFQISENISMMSNFSVFHHFGKLTMNKGFCAVKVLILGEIFSVKQLLPNSSILWPFLWPKRI